MESIGVGGKKIYWSRPTHAVKTASVMIRREGNAREKNLKVRVSFTCVYSHRR